MILSSSPLVLVPDISALIILIMDMDTERGRNKRIKVLQFCGARVLQLTAAPSHCMWHARTFYFLNRHSVI